MLNFSLYPTQSVGRRSQAFREVALLKPEWSSGNINAARLMLTLCMDGIYSLQPRLSEMTRLSVILNWQEPTTTPGTNHSKISLNIIEEEYKDILKWIKEMVFHGSLNHQLRNKDFNKMTKVYVFQVFQARWLQLTVVTEVFGQYLSPC